MKVIVSHDVDHLKWSEHFKDSYILKYFAKAFYYGLTGKISPKVFKRRLAALSSRINMLPELCKFNKDNNIPATFFVGMANALVLSYNLNDAKATVKWLDEQGFDTGVHGIEYATQKGVDTEYSHFRTTTDKPFGIRNHYLRLTAQTLKFQANAGYLFGSTTYGVIHPFKVGNMWEFPISLMDVYTVTNPHNNYNKNLWQTNTMAVIEEAEKANLPYFVINFHDPFFSDTYENIRDWYLFIIDFFKKNNYTFISFKDAINELEISGKSLAITL